MYMHFKVTFAPPPTCPLPLCGCHVSCMFVTSGTVTLQDSNWHSTEGDKRDDLSNNKWFNSTQSLAGDKKFIKKTGNWACK
jgi:hypothetical protein